MFKSVMADYRPRLAHTEAPQLPAGFADTPDGTEVETYAYDAALAKRPCVTYQGGLVTPQLYDLLQATKKKFRGLEGVLSGFQASYTYMYLRNDDAEGDPDSRLSQVTVYSSMYVRFEGSDICVARIGFDDVRRARSGTPQNKYYVHSPYIVNYKYSDYSDQRHLLASKNIDVTVRNAAKFVRPVNELDLIEISVREGMAVQAALERDNSALYNEYASKESRIRRNADKLAEAILTVKNGGVLLTEIDEFVTEYAEARDAYRAARDRQVRGMHILKQATPLGERLLVTQVPDLRRLDHANKQPDIKYYSPETLPEDIQGKLAMCMVAGEQNYVPEIGMLISEEAALIEVSDEPVE